jgi:hypothetical protein
MRILSMFVVAIAALGFTLGSAAPAEAASSRCPENRLCLYDGKGFTGEWNFHQCDTDVVNIETYYFHGGRLSHPFRDRTSSVINNCGKSWRLVDRANGQDYRTTAIYGGQWLADLGGWRGLDNKVDLIRTSP